MQNKAELIKHLEAVTIHLQQDPLDIGRFIAWRKAAILAGRTDLSGIQVGDRVLVKSIPTDAWSSAWIGTVVGQNGPTVSVNVENNQILLRRPLVITNGIVSVPRERLQVLDPALGWPENYAPLIEQREKDRLAKVAVEAHLKEIEAQKVAEEAQRKAAEEAFARLKAEDAARKKAIIDAEAAEKSRRETEQAAKEKEERERRLDEEWRLRIKDSPKLIPTRRIWTRHI